MDNINFGIIAALMTSVTWSLGSYAYTQLFKSYPATVINFNRALIAWPFFFILSLLNHQGISEFFEITSSQLILTQTAYLASSIIFSYAFADILFYISAANLSFPVAQAVGAMYPLWTTVIGVVIFHHQIKGVELLGIILSIAGIISIILSGKKGIFFFIKSKIMTTKTNLIQTESPSVTKGNIPKGLLLAFITSIFWGLNTLATHKGGTNFPFSLAGLIRMSSGLLICTILTLKFNGFKRSSLFFKIEDYKKFGLVISFEAFAGSSFFIYGLSHTDLTIGPVLSSLAPLFSLPLGIYFGKEKISPFSIFGILLIFLGCLVLVYI